MMPGNWPCYPHYFIKSQPIYNWPVHPDCALGPPEHCNYTAGPG